MIEMRGHGKEMMQDEAMRWQAISRQPMRWLGVMSFCLVCGGFAACAGSKTPSISDDFEETIGDTFGNGSVGVAGAGTSGGGRGGRGGSANAGSAGSSSAAGNGGAAGSGACNGFAIVQRNCNGENCHGTGSVNANFAESEAIAAAFAGEDPVTADCSMDGPLINTDNPRGSLLIQKVNGTVPCGNAMPLVGSLSDSDIACLEEWIREL
jgi:hypothetical protein